MIDRFRAYTLIKAVVATNRVDAKGRRIKAEQDAEGVAFSGPVPKSGIVKFDSGDAYITKVAFYGGPIEEEVCRGAIEVDASGPIEVDSSPLLVDEAEEAAGE